MIKICEALQTRIAERYNGASSGLTMKYPAIDPNPLQIVEAVTKIVLFLCPTTFFTRYAFIAV